MNDTMTGGVVDAPINGAVAAPETPEVQTGAQGTETDPAVPAEGSQESSDGSPVNGQQNRQRGKSVYSQVRELQSKLREQREYWESRIGATDARYEELKNMIAGNTGRKPSKTFWEAPEEVLEERLSSHLTELEKRMQSKFEQTQAQREASQVRTQEVSEAAKFIRSQKGMTEEDIQDIREILQSNPQLENLSPMDQAEFALFKWQKERGITDNAAKKARASTVSGAPLQGAGPKIWTKSEVEAEIAKFPTNPANYTPEDEARFKKLDDEWRRAVREGRMKN